MLNIETHSDGKSYMTSSICINNCGHIFPENDAELTCFGMLTENNGEFQILTNVGCVHSTKDGQQTVLKWVMEHIEEVIESWIKAEENAQGWSRINGGKVTFHW